MCDLSNFALFHDFIGLRRLSPKSVTGVRLVRHVQVMPNQMLRKFDGYMMPFVDEYIYMTYART